MGLVLTALRRAAIALSLVALAACSSIETRHGYVPADADLEAIEVGTSTREDVALTVGRPATSGVMAGGAWYYVGSRFKQIGMRAPEEVDRQVVAISFDDEGIVTNVERFGLSEGQVVAISRRVTEPNIRGLGVIRQLLGSIGRISAGSILGPRE